MSFDYSVLNKIEKITFELRALYASYGYHQFRMGRFEEYDFYSKAKDLLVSDRIITFTDTNGKLMALKPDVTLSIIKSVKNEAGKLYKLCYNENVYRVSKKTDSFREIMQSGLECIGDIDQKSINEVLLLAAKSLDTISSDYILDISNIDIVTSVVSRITLEKDIAGKLLSLVSEKNVHEIKALLKSEEIDENLANPLVELIGIYGPMGDTLPMIHEFAKKYDVIKEYENLAKSLEIFKGTEYENNIRLDFSIAGNVNYYNGILFEGFVNGIPESVLSGGQYDKLVRRMKKSSGAIGFAVYTDNLERL